MEEKQSTSSILRKIAIPVMLMFGTGTTVIQKFMLEQQGTGVAEYGVHKFSKPWFQTLIMFLGELCALVVYEVSRCVNKRKQNMETESKESRWKLYCILGIPALCDLLSTGIMNVGLLYIQASVWQMLRGAQVIFGSIFHAFCLRRRYKGYMWASVVIVALSLVVVGSAAVCSTGVAVEGVTQGQVILAIFLTIGSQVIRAAQVILEDFFIHDKDISPILIVGVQGFWGTIATAFVVLPISQYLGGEQGNGIHEDTIDTALMLWDNKILILFSIAYVLVILGLNIFGMIVTEITNAVMRTIVEAMRTLCIWIVQMIIFYSIQNTEYGHHHPTIGESWTIWSWMQLAGFALLFTGMLTYNGSVHMPFFDYKPIEESTDQKSDTTAGLSNVVLRDAE